MSSVTYAPARLQCLTAAEVESLASQLPLRPLPNLRRRLDPPPTRRSRRTAAHRAAERAPVVSRRMRRIHNDALLALSSAQHEGMPLTREDVKKLYETSSRSAWSTLADDHEQRRLWRRFVEMEEREQGEVVQERDAVRREGGPLEMVDRRFRELLKNRRCVVLPIVGQVEKTVVDMPPGGEVAVGLNDALGRLVAHGVAQFHQLGHRSVGKGEKRVTVIQKDKRSVGGCRGRLMDVLV